jgi:hypothetical protein
MHAAGQMFAIAAWASDLLSQCRRACIPRHNRMLRYPLTSSPSSLVPMGIRKPILLTIALLVPAKLLAAEALPRTILFLDQSETRGPFYREVFWGFRDAVNADLESQVTIYRESLDLSRRPTLASSGFHCRYLDCRRTACPA